MSEVLSLLADKLDPPKHPYFDKPVEWIRAKGGYLWSKQCEIMESLRDNRYTAVPSCFDSGKSFSASAAVAWWLDTRPVGQAFAVTTAPTNDQVRAILWREIRRRHADWGLSGRITLDAQWYMNESLVAYGRKPADYNPTAFQGIHDRYVLVIIDEAAGIPPGLYDAVDGLVTNADCRVLAIGNPADDKSHFAKICKPGSGWHVIEISAFDTPNLTGEQVPAWLRPLLVSPEWVEERRKRWGVTSPMYVSKVMAKFPGAAKDSLFESRWVLAAQNRDMEPDEADACYGVDVARFGEDFTQVYLRQGGVVRHVMESAKQSTVTTAVTVRDLVLAHRIHPLVQVDDDGIGGAVTDQLVDFGLEVAAFHNGGQTTNPQRFGNLRAEAYWRLREALAGPTGSGIDGYVDLDPADDELAAQLLSMRYRVDAKGKIWVESKDDMRKRGVASPDRADALCYAWYRGLVPVMPFNQDHGGSSMLTADLLTREM